MPITSRSRIVRGTPIGIDPRDSSAADGHGWSAGVPRAKSEGKNLSLQRCTSLKGLPSRRKQRENDHEHVAEKLQRRLPKFNQFSQNGVFGRDRSTQRSITRNDCLCWFAGV